MLTGLLSDRPSLFFYQPDFGQDKPVAFTFTTKEIFAKWVIFGPWWWCNGQRPRLLLWWPEFEPSWLLIFCSVLQKQTQMKEKESGVSIFWKKGKIFSVLPCQSVSENTSGSALASVHKTSQFCTTTILASLANCC